MSGARLPTRRSPGVGRGLKVTLLATPWPNNASLICRLQTEVAQAWMIFRAWGTKFPVELAVGFGDLNVVDAGMPM